MNRTYKVIWSKARHCYVVVSELTKSQHKSSSKSELISANVHWGGDLGKVAVAAIVAGLLTFGGVAYSPVLAADKDIVDKGAQPIAYDISPVNDGTNIAIGKNAKVFIGGGTQESMLSFGEKAERTYTEKWGFKIPTGWNIHSNERAKKNLPEAIAIGTNSYARTGSIEIGAHTLAENKISIGDTTADQLRQFGVASTTLGTNSYTGGGFATTIGSYNVQTNQYEAAGLSDTGNATKNAFATVIGTFNSNESLSSYDSTSGVANMISGTANKVTNSNGAIVMGAGNSVKDSIASFDTSAYSSLFKSAADMQKALMKGVASSAGGATLVIGGANKAENTLKTQILGVNNTVTGTEDTPADYNMIDGFNTTINGASHLYTIGTNNKITNAKNTILFGDDYQNASGLADSVIIGNNRVKGDEKAEFAYFNNQKNIVSIGNKNVLNSTDGSISIGNNNFMWRSGGNPDTYGYDTGNVAIGNNTYINSYLNQGDSIVIGKNATVINMGGSLEKAFAFGTPEGKDYSGSIAIGQNSYARSGSTMIGIHNYQGKLGDLDIDFTKDKSGGHSGIGEYQESIDATTIGNNSYNNGVFSTVVGSYTAVSGLYHNEKWGEKPYGVQNFGAAVLGSLNSVEGLTSTEHNTAGMADSILGSANRTKNANGTIMVGAGNVVEDSINDFDASEIKTKNGIATPNALSEAMRTSIKNANGGGAAAIVGNGNEVKQSTNVSVLGSKNKLTKTKSAQVLGDNREVTDAEGTVIIGSASGTTPITTDKKNVTILGYNANATVDGGVALGAGSVASREAGVAGYDPATKTDSTDSSATWKATDAAVSVGKADGTMTRQITGVAAGTQDTDAVNVAQLQKALSGAKDGNDTLKSDTNALTLNGNTLSMNVEDTAGHKVSGSVDLSKFAQAVDTNTTYTLTGEANPDNNTTTITLKDSNGRENSVTVATKDTDTRNTVKAGENVTLDTKDNADGSHEYTVKVKADGKVEAGSTKIVSGGTVYNETRVAKDGNFVKQSNTAGENLSALDNQVTANTESIYHMNGRISDLDNRVNKVGAGAAALAALHPLDFDPDDKWDFAVGYGNYRNANSVALGAFYRPNEDTMFSLGTNFGNGENMFNAGLSFKIGQGGSGITTSKTAMAKKIESLENTVDQQDKKIAELEALVKEQGEMIRQYVGKK